MFKKLFKRKQKSTGLLGGLSPKELLAVRAVSAIIILAGVALVYGSLQQSEVENLRLDVESTYNTLYSNAKATDNMEAFDLTKIFDVPNNQLVLSNGDRVDGAGGYKFNFEKSGVIQGDPSNVSGYSGINLTDSQMGMLFQVRDTQDLAFCSNNSDDDGIIPFQETSNANDTDDGVCRGAINPNLLNSIIYTFKDGGIAKDFNEKYLDSLGEVVSVGAYSGVGLVLNGNSSVVAGGGESEPNEPTYTLSACPTSSDDDDYTKAEILENINTGGGNLIGCKIDSYDSNGAVYIAGLTNGDSDVMVVSQSNYSTSVVVWSSSSDGDGTLAASETDGLANTTNMKDAKANDNTLNFEAAEVCWTKGTDWYLPAKDELNVIHINQSNLGTLPSNYYYWSSSEHSSDNARRHYFSNDSPYSNQKTNSSRVRCASRF